MRAGERRYAAAADGFAGVAGFSGDPSSSGLFVTVDGGGGDGFAGAVVAGGETSVVAGVGCGVSGTFRAHPAAPIIMDNIITTTRIS